MSLEPPTIYMEMIQQAECFIYYFRGLPKGMVWPEWLKKMKFDLELSAATYRLSLNKAREQGRVGQHGRWF